MIKLHCVIDGKEIWLNERYIEMFGESIEEEGTEIYMATRDNWNYFLVSETTEEILTMLGESDQLI